MWWCLCGVGKRYKYDISNICGGNMKKVKRLEEFIPAALAIMLMAIIGIGIYLQNQPQTL